MDDANGSPVPIDGGRAQAAAAAAGGVSGDGSQAQAAAAAAEKLHALAKEVREVKRAAKDVVPAAVETLRAAVERLEEAAEDVLKARDLEVPPTFTEICIKNLFDLDDHPMHKKALEEWRRESEDLITRISTRQARLGDVSNHIFNIIQANAVFLGVVFTAVSQLTQTA